MKYLQKNWTKKDDGILYFFQRIEEMLFHYSDDIVRVPIHNTRTLMTEYFRNENEYKKDKVKAYQLDQILDELCHSLKSDKILHEKFGEEFILQITESIKKNKGDGIRYLYNKLNNKAVEEKYFNWCVQYLKKHANQHNHKQEIEFALRSWLSELLLRGYSPEYIYKYLHKHIANEITPPNQLLDEFIDHFDMNTVDHLVYFAFAPDLLQYRELFASRMHILFDDDGYFCKVKPKNNYFVGYVHIEALDRYKAAAQAYNNILTFIKYYRVISNRREELVRLDSIVRIANSSQTYRIPIKSNGYRSIEIEPKASLEVMIDSIIIECQQKPRETYAQLCKIIDLHNAAIEQHDLNDGFLNLWSILEIVSSSIPSESKIEKVINGVLPILQNDYFDVVFDNIDQDLKDNLPVEDYSKLITTLTIGCNVSEGINYISKLIFLPQYEELLNEYFLKLAQFPVIRQKIYSLWVLKDSKAQILNLSKKYAQRVKWHIYRLYRTRNSIVHSGESHMRIQALGEHLHLYVDRIINELLIRLTNDNTLLTISDVLIDTRLSLEKKQTYLNTYSPVTSDDINIINNNDRYVKITK